jgi:hypothetical protein
MRTLLAKIRKGRIRFPVAPIACTKVVYLRSLGWSFFRFLGFSKLVITSYDDILPIKKPDSLKLYMSLSAILYFAFIL